MVNATRNIKEEELYILETIDDNIIKDRAKIGVAKDARKRITTLKQASPIALREYRTYFASELYPYTARQVEGRVKTLLKFNDYCSHENSREWFNMPGHVLEWFVSGAINSLVTHDVTNKTLSVQEMARLGKAKLLYSANNGRMAFQLPSGRLVDGYGDPISPSEALKGHPINEWKSQYELQEVSA